jgi:integrase/recombinase XerD
MGRPTDIIVRNKTYRQLANEFYEYLIQLGYGKHGCRTKWLRIREFFSYLERKVTTDITAVTTQDIVGYHEHMKQRPSKKDGNALSQKTVSDGMRMIQQFFDMLQAQGKISTNPGSTLRIEYVKYDSPRVALTQAEIKELYQHTHEYKERAILALAYGCGLRVNEIQQCNIEDLKLRDGYVIVPKGKGNKTRVVPISKTVAKDLSDYLYKERLQVDTKEKKAFILHTKGGRMRKYTYNKILHKLIARTKNENIKAKQISLHNLRHSIATHLIEQGVQLERVREFLGHSQLESTEVYTHISQQQLNHLVNEQPKNTNTNTRRIRKETVQPKIRRRIRKRY